MSSDRNINLLPEDLRAKEDKSQQPRDFHIDLVVPDSVEQSRPLKSAGLFGQKFKNVFSKKTRFQIPQAPKPGQVKKTEKDTGDIDFDRLQSPKKQKREFSSVHIPKKEARPEERKIHYVKKSGFDFSLPDSSVPSQKKISFWVKLKSKFAGRPKQDKKGKEPQEKNQYQAQPLKNGADSILLKSLHDDAKNSAPAPKVETQKPVLEEEPIKEPLARAPAPEAFIPALKTSFDQLETKKRDFSIPEIVSPPLQDNGNKSKASTDRFHRPTDKQSDRFVDGGGGLDLIPKSVRTKSWRQIGILALAAFLGSILVAGSFYAYLSFQEHNIRKQQERRSSQISDLEKKILEYELINKEISALGQEIKTVHNLLNKHIYWTNFFAMLEKYTPTEVYYQGINAGNKGALTLNAIGRDYDSPARLLKLLQQPEAREFVSMASISAASLQANGVAFSVTLVLNENLFYYGYGPRSQ
ncbi:MAG: hypothetical protein PHO91_02585 [Patescibacteria group bacterium]|nr:hypothetical protein [Patescibacteria group bacterium]